LHKTNRHQSIDALVNNAAVTGEGPGFPGSLSQRLSATFLTNTIGPAIVVEAFAPLLAKSAKTPRIINVTSGAGSVGLRLDMTNPHQKMKAVSAHIRTLNLGCHAF
jgi:NAD(P)-dependent dehydrogenase (short-subunit alcohol dehydrogenase family)